MLIILKGSVNYEIKINNEFVVNYGTELTLLSI